MHLLRAAARAADTVREVRPAALPEQTRRGELRGADVGEREPGGRGAGDLHGRDAPGAARGRGGRRMAGCVTVWALSSWPSTRSRAARRWQIMASCGWGARLAALRFDDLTAGEPVLVLCRIGLPAGRGLRRAAARRPPSRIRP